MPVPLTYRQIKADIEERIASNEFPPEDDGVRWLPSYAKFADHYHVSVTTVARAVRLLRDDGIVRGAPGRGLYVPDDDP